ncbi:hypothetical protein ACLKA6_016855 [Drosophila palustris]
MRRVRVIKTPAPTTAANSSSCYASPPSFPSFPAFPSLLFLLYSVVSAIVSPGCQVIIAFHFAPPNETSCYLWPSCVLMHSHFFPSARTNWVLN